MGKLASCGCDHSVAGEGRGWSWGGCSDNIKYGAKLAAKFLDSREKGADMKSMMNLHNNRAGRLVSRSLLIHLSSSLKPTVTI